MFVTGKRSLNQSIDRSVFFSCFVSLLMIFLFVVFFRRGSEDVTLFIIKEIYSSLGIPGKKKLQLA